MNLIEKIVDKVYITFAWKGNKKKVIKQTGQGLLVNQESQSTTNIYHIQNVNIASIQELAGASVLDSSDVLKAAGQRFLVEQKTKQENLSAIVNKAELANIVEPHEIERDWFFKWMDIAQMVSREDIQEILAKILSKEVKNAEGFSLRTLEILKNLSKVELAIFQKFCDVSWSLPFMEGIPATVICAPYGNPGNNDLSILGLSYGNLTILQDAGLIQGDLNSWRVFKIPELFQIPFSIGSSLQQLQVTEECAPSNPQINVINFTTAGLELRSVLNLGSNPEYIAKFLEWIKNEWKMVPVTKPSLARL